MSISGEHMTYFVPPVDNIPFLIKRCDFEADTGLLKVALDRLRDLQSQYPDHPRLLYAEGLLRRDYLGQGLVARDLFERAYRAAVSLGVRGDVVWFSASNAATLARTEVEFREWAALAQAAQPTTERDGFRRLLQRLDGTPYRRMLEVAAEEHLVAGHHGSSAAHLEVALSIDGMSRAVHAKMRRERAQRIRLIDLRDQEKREARREWYPPEERLALHQAMAELEQVLSLDVYDPEVWNLKSAWQNLMEQYEAALGAANRALELRNPYPKALINAATAQYRLGRWHEARISAEEALRQASSLDDPSDFEQAEVVAAAYSAPPRRTTMEDLVPDLEIVLRAARRSSDEEFQNISYDVTLQDLMSRLLDHGAMGAPSMRGHVPLIAELLSDFTPETVCGVLLNAKRFAAHLFDIWISAAVYLATHAEGVEQRDAARLITLLLLIPLEAPAIRDLYRTIILRSQVAGADRLSQLNEAVCRELTRIHRALPDCIRA